MIRITETETAGWRHAIRGMRNPKDSWDKSDSIQGCSGYKIGTDDHKLALNLANAGTDHGTVLRFIQCYCDVEGPLYWWKEMDRYRMGVEKISCSTMHTIHKRDLTMDDFSHERNLCYGNLNHTIDALNYCRQQYIATKDKKWWDSLIQLLPSSFNQKRTMLFSYAALRAIYHARKHHKLQEWHDFCDWIRSLPYSELITGEES